MKKLILTAFIVLSLFACSIRVFGHNALLNVEYDDCQESSDFGGGYDEKWYEIVNDNSCWHLPHTTMQIKYYISDSNENGNISWSSYGVSSTRVNEILDDYIESMKKWNDVYFYYQNSDGTIEKKKVINIVEGTENDYNIVIFPSTIGVASTSNIVSSNVLSITENGVSHLHYQKWKMGVSVSEFLSMTNEEYEHMSSRTGAHEMGHILGLRDIDSVENSLASNYHHEEILMGYAKDGAYLSRQTEITYRDLAGVAITRGIHTDNDHKWLYDSSSSESGNYKLICSICNGVKYVSSLSSYTYSIYKSCNSNHSLSSNNMMAVGCYQNKDYYKCKYCRYVAPFTYNVTQSYQYSEYSTFLHKIINNVIGLNYTMYESHTYDQTHTWVNNTQHRSSCVCGEETLQGHAVTASDFNCGAQTAICLLCGGSASIGFIQNSNVIRVSENGSYILSNGLVVLQNNDIEAYLNNTLVFRDIDLEIE